MTVRLLLVTVAAAAAIAGCSGGAGTLIAAPGVSDPATVPRGAATPSPTPSPAPTAAPGAVAFGPASFAPGAGAGTCEGSGLAFNVAGGATATLNVSEPNYAGQFAVSSNSNPSVASAAVTGETVTVTALAAGNTTIAVSGAPGAPPATCTVGVTLTAGSVE